MTSWRAVGGGLITMVLVAGIGSAQEFDAVVSSTNRKPATILDEISDPSERDDFRALYRSAHARQRLSMAEAFV